MNEKQCFEIITNLAEEYALQNRCQVAQQEGAITNDFIDRGLSGTTVHIAQALKPHISYINNLINYIMEKLKADFNDIPLSNFKNALCHLSEQEFKRISNVPPRLITDANLHPMNQLNTQFQRELHIQAEMLRGVIQNKCAISKNINDAQPLNISDKSDTRLDIYKRWILNHKILSIVILLGVVVISLGAFSESIWKIFDSYKRVVETDKISESEPSVPPATSDEIKITKVRPIIDQPTKIRDFAGTGIMSLHWELVLSNNGEKDLSVIDYDVLQVLKKNPISYTDLRQGLYFLHDTKLQPVKFPMIIPAGHSSALFIRLGVMIDDKAYAMIKEEFNGNQPQTASSIIDFLRSCEIDIFGNPFSKNGIGVYSLPPLNDLQDPVFAVTFKTARNTEIADLISLYKYGLYRLATE